MRATPPLGPDERLGLANRLGWAAVSFVAIVALCVLRVRIHGDTTLVDVYSDPVRFEGVPVDLATEALIVEVDEEAFTLRELDREIRVHARLDPSDVGRFVHVRGTFHAAAGDQAAWVEPIGVRVHKGRRWKIWVSLIPLAWVALLLLSSFRIDPSRLAVELREHA